jgi:TfoX/Sxy family transcriptional regulator of competence genes
VAFDEELAGRVRSLLDGRADVDEKRMFGGLAFLLAGNMCVGVHEELLIARLAQEEADELLDSEPGVRPMDFTGRPMRGWLFVEPEATAEDADLERWVRRCEAFAASLPPKPG